MEGEEGGIRLSKRFSDGKVGGGEVDYKTKSGTAWSHSYLNQKPWHPLSYPNQRRKWIAEQTHATHQRRSEEVAREYAQEQDFFRQTALISKKEKEKVELMQAVSFMYVRPPGFNAESAKAAEIADEKKREDLSKEPQDPIADGASSSMPPRSLPGKEHLGEEKKKPRPKDVFGRPLPTEEEFEILKNAPRLETGVPARVKPFGVEVRNVKCLRCGSYGHQSGDRECPLKDAIMPNEESRLKRDDPLNAILANTDPSEPLKWELKQKPGISPPRGGFNPDDPNQQIVAEDIFDEYGGFLSTGEIPELLANFSKKPKKSKQRKHKKRDSVHSESEASSGDGERSSKKRKRKVNRKKQDHAKSSSSDTSDFNKDQGKSRHKSSYSSEDSDSDRADQSRKTMQKHSFSPKGSDHPTHSRSKHSRQRHYVSSETESSGPDPDGHHGSYKNSNKHSYSPEDHDDRYNRSRKNREKHYYSAKVSNRSGHKRKHSRKRTSYSSEDSGPAGYRRSRKSIDEPSYLLDDSNHQRQPRVKGSSHKHSSTVHYNSQKQHRNYGPDRYHGSQKSSNEHSYSSEGSDSDKDDRSRKIKQKHSHTRKGSELLEGDMSKDGGSKKHCYSSKDSGADGRHRSGKGRDEHSYASDNSDHQGHPKLRRSSHKH